MKLKLWQVDAFTGRLFGGNPAAVCPLDRWLPDPLLQAIAEENNMSETAFFVPTARGWHLRWFTPVREVDLCGHATLASAHVLFAHLGHSGGRLLFETRSGDLVVERREQRLAMDFPASKPQPCAAPRALLEGLRVAPREVLAADDYVAVFDDEETVRSLAPDMARLAQLDRRGVCVTAPGRTADFVSRFFAPKYGIPEDPVTGSAHCLLTPFWAERLGKARLHAQQVSKRGGELECLLRQDRVELSGEAVTFMEGEITLDDQGRG